MFEFIPGGALDGIEFLSWYHSCLVGNKTDDFKDFPLNPNEFVSSFIVRCGAWIDAVHIVTTTGRRSKIFDNKNDGGL